MSIPLNPKPYDSGTETPPPVAPGPASSQTTQTQGPTQTSTGTSLPLTEQPVQDQITPSGDQPQPAVAAYVASAQGPLLTKPQEQKQEQKPEKKLEKDGSLKTDQTQSQDDSSSQVNGEHKAHPEQQDDGGQGSGGTGGGNTGSNSGGSSGGFSGGDGSGHSRKDPSDPIQMNQSTDTDSVDSPADVNETPPSSGDSTDAAEKQQAAYLKALDPTNSAIISAETGLYSPPLNPAQFFDNAGKMMQEITDINLALVNSLPDGPDKMRFTDFLKLVQDALNQFQQLLRELQLNDSKGAKERAQAQLETSLEKIEEQRKQQAEMARKTEEAAKKAKLMSGLAILFAFLMIIFFVFVLPIVMPLLILTLPPLGVLVLALIVAEFLDQCAKAVGQKPFAIQGMANAVMEMIDAMVEANPASTESEKNNIKAALKVIATAIIMAVATAMAPAFMVFGGCMTVLDFLSASHCVKAAAMAAGMEESEADQVEMYVGIAVGAIFAIAAFAVAFIMPLGAAGGALSTMVKTAAQKAAEFIQKIFEYFIKVSDVVTQNIIKGIQATLKEALNPENWQQATSLGLQTTNAVATYNYQHILADIAIINGQLDSYTELKDSTIQSLKRMIKQLLDALGGISDDIAAVTRSLKQTHVGVSQITGDLFG